MEASTATRPSPQPPEQELEAGQKGSDGTEAVRKLARDESGKKTTNAEKVDALEWFLSDEPEAFTHSMEYNVGSPAKPKWVTWEMQPVDLDTLRRIRRQSQGNRQTRRQGGGELDEVEANLRIVVEGTVTPDLKEIAKQKGIVDPADALRIRFSHKPGLLGQIAGEIMSISGYDDEDVREVDAAGNS